MFNISQNKYLIAFISINYKALIYILEKACIFFTAKRIGKISILLYLKLVIAEILVIMK